MSKKNRVTRSDLNKVSRRVLMFENSINYERMQSYSFTYAIIPILEQLYKEEDLSNALKRHLQFFNSNVLFASLIMGVTISLEEKRAEGEEISDEMINSIKSGLMGPGAGIGDALFWGTLVPLIGGLTASMAMTGNIFAPILHQVLRIGIFAGIVFFGVHYGYREGINVLDKIGKEGLHRLTENAKLLAATVIGGLVSTLVIAKTDLVLTFGEMALNIQEDLLDAIAPNILPLLIFIGSYYLINKKKLKPITMIGLIFIVGILATYLGLLV